MTTRLNKYLADRGVCSRRQADALIESGAVLVNGVKATLGVQVGEGDEVSVNGKVLVNEKPAPIVIAYYKPVGIITSVDPKAHDNVISQIKIKEKIFPIGRLDVASSGLLLLTNDGELSERITHPRFYHEKEYLVTVDKGIKGTDLTQMEDGMMILGSMTKRAKVKKVGQKTFRIVLTEGRNRQIRRMCEALGYDVVRLRRERVMNIELGDMEVGSWRYLTKEELFKLRRQIGLPNT